MPSFSRPLFALLLVLSLSLDGCGRTSPPPPPGKPAVTVVRLEPQRVTLTRQLPGRTSAYVVAEVRPQVTGIVKQRLFDEGSLVTAGQPLYQLDDASYRAAWNSAKASLARAQAAVDVAQLRARRAAELITAHAISQQDHDDALAQWRQAQADIAVAQAQVESTAVELGYARITSPIDGRIGKSTVTQGALVTADQATPLATVQQLDPIYVDLAQSATETLELRRDLAGGKLRRAEGVPVTILLEDGTRFPEQGELKFTDVAVDPMTGSFSLRVVVPNPDHLLMPGMYVRAVVSNAILEQGLLVPQQGIARDAKGNASAMILTDEDTVQRRDVEVSRTIGDDWLVKDGLNAGDRVIVEGLQKIQPGMQVVANEASLSDKDLEPGDGPSAAAADSP